MIQQENKHQYLSIIRIAGGIDDFKGFICYRWQPYKIESYCKEVTKDLCNSISKFFREYLIIVNGIYENEEALRLLKSAEGKYERVIKIPVVPVVRNEFAETFILKLKFRHMSTLDYPNEIDNLPTIKTSDYIMDTFKTLTPL